MHTLRAKDVLLDRVGDAVDVVRGQRGQAEREQLRVGISHDKPEAGSLDQWQRAEEGSPTRAQGAGERRSTRVTGNGLRTKRDSLPRRERGVPALQAGRDRLRGATQHPSEQKSGGRDRSRPPQLPRGAYFFFLAAFFLAAFFFAGIEVIPPFSQSLDGGGSLST